MSYTSNFHSLLASQPSGQFSKGLRFLMSASNLEFMQRDAAELPSEPMAHVLAHQENMARSQVFRVFAQDAIDCPPPVVKAAVVDLPVPVAAGLVAGILPARMSNLDCCNKLVKRGRSISYSGLRGIVIRVSLGRCAVGFVDAFGRYTGVTEWLVCERVQVVA